MTDSSSLKLSKWIELAEKKDLILTPSHYEKLTKDQKYDAVRVDYIRFLFLEAPKIYDAKKVYDPQDLYKDIKEVIKITGKIKEESSPVIRSCDDCEGVKSSDEITLNYGFRNCTLKSDNCFYKLHNYKWLATGNGDNWSRWMLWDDLAKMPKVYFKKS